MAGWQAHFFLPKMCDMPNKNTLGVVKKGAAK